MAALNMVVTPILSSRLASAMRSPLLAEYKIASAEEAVSFLKNFEAHQKVALVLGSDPTRNMPFANARDECYDVMFYTDSPDVLYRIIVESAGTDAEVDLCLFEELDHDIMLSQSYLNGEDSRFVLPSRVLRLMAGALGARKVSADNMPYIMDVADLGASVGHELDVKAAMRELLAAKHS